MARKGATGMTPIKFVGFNCIYAEDQPEYIPLPVFRENDGCVTSCWKLTFKERVRVLFGGCVFLSQLTFNEPLQPVKLFIGWRKRGLPE